MPARRLHAASGVAFMGIGLTDPIPPSIARGLQASPSRVSLLFTSYLLITALAMPVTAFVSSRIRGESDRGRAKRVGQG